MSSLYWKGSDVVIVRLDCGHMQVGLRSRAELDTYCLECSVIAARPIPIVRSPLGVVPVDSPAMIGA